MKWLASRIALQGSTSIIRQEGFQADELARGRADRALEILPRPGDVVLVGRAISVVVGNLGGRWLRLAFPAQRNGLPFARAGTGGQVRVAGPEGALLLLFRFRREHLHAVLLLMLGLEFGSSLRGHRCPKLPIPPIQRFALRDATRPPEGIILILITDSGPGLSLRGFARAEGAALGDPL